MSADSPHRLQAKYAVFLPLRNGEPYVAKAIESVLTQSCSDFILIILENKSSDNSLSIAQSYHDPRITVLEAPTALNIYDNWKRIYDLINSGSIHSQFTTTLGHDDVLYPDFLKTIDDLISTYPDASLYQTHFDIIDQVGTIQRPCKPIPTRESAQDFFLSRCWGNRDSFGAGYVFRSKDYVRVGGIPDLPYLLWSDDLLVIQLTKLSYKACSPHLALAYRSYKKSLSGGISVDKFEAQIAALSLYLDEIKRHHADLLKDDYDRIALGFLLARIMDWYDFPLRKTLMKSATAEAVEHLSAEAKRLMQDNTLHGLSQSHFLNRLYSWLRQMCVMLYFSSNRLSKK